MSSFSGIDRRYNSNYFYHYNASSKVTDNCKVILGSIYIMMTFGMRHYLTNTFNKIIIYPDVFHSKMNKALHKGEFNPMLGIVVFSWKDVVAGIEIENDNLHLGIHEFAHVLSIHSKKSNDSGAIVFSSGVDELLDYLSVGKNLHHIKNLGYIRKYAFTNSFEFIAVLLEYYFESPEVFKKLLPDVYNIIRKMLNNSC
ncbi:zinc-dependent peptidase [Flavobacteriaceae bacterium S356]|uniref:Zinc-dependent peptidase n=1 Tax=Asprobacillus argus TaxID=3076534 RepID=A0ABU3LB89_9FLAO|nr:zinc-dependent peptidase [Flavobacteriaceae bacterium S356]